MKKINLAFIISCLLMSAVSAQEIKKEVQLSDFSVVQKILASDPDNGEANFKMAMYYGSADYLDIAKQLEYLKKSADLSFAEGQLQYGFYLLNQGLRDEGLAYLNASATQNHVKAMTLLGDLYFAGYQDKDGNNVIQADAEKAIIYLNQAIERDSQDARYTLGYLYLDDKFGQQDILKAIELFESNIDYKHQTGDLSSIVALIDVYVTNPQIKDVQRKVVDLYYLANLQGYVPSFYPVGLMQKEGVKGDRLEVVKDLESAFDNLYKAARAGYIDAMFNIGEMYFKGEGVEQSDRNAYIWMAIAEELSDSETKYSDTILELIPRKDRESAVNEKKQQLSVFMVVPKS